MDNTIKDTVKLSTNFATIYKNENGHYIAVDADGNEKDITANVGSKSRTLVQSSNGEQLVIDSKGQLMGVTEYKQTGGNKTLLAQRSAEKESQMATTGNVTFTSIGDYLFDTYDSYKSHTASQNYAQRFLSIGAGNYRPAYACIESYAKVKLNADPFTNITFKTERGVPVLCNNGELSITGVGDHDTLAIYAYKDTTLVGKVNVMCYDKVTRKICLVPIGKSNVPSAETLKNGLDAIFAKLMVDFDVTVSEAIEIDYSNGTNFTHGGSGMIGVYNTDQKAAITKLEELGTDNETIYLFMVEDAVTLNETDGYTVTSGYMPRGYQYGFIYKELTNARTIAHEIAHGAFHLEHTFAQSNYLAPEATTDNLMDYNGGTTLNHWQWKDVHDPKRVWLKWAQGEEGSENISLTGKFYAVLNENSDYRLYNNSEITILKGTPIKLSVLPDEFMTEYIETCLKSSNIQYDSFEIPLDNVKWVDIANNNELEGNDLAIGTSVGKYCLKATIDSIRVTYQKTEEGRIKNKKLRPIAVPKYNSNNENETSDIVITINVVESPIVRIEPADRDNFYLKFGYDDALVKENQLNGDYETTIIGGQTYYMPWLNIQQGQNASMKLNIGDNIASTLLPSTYFVVKHEEENSFGDIKINGLDSLVIKSGEIGNPFEVTCLKEMKGYVYVYCCDSVTNQRHLSGVLEVNCYETLKPISLSIISTRRQGETKYPDVDLQATIDKLNKFYVQVGVEFQNYSLEQISVAKGTNSKFSIYDVYNQTEQEEQEQEGQPFKLYIVKKYSIDTVGGESKTGHKVSFVFDESRDVVYAHELGHAIVLHHVFIDTQNRDGRQYHVQKCSTNNIMDYTNNVYDPRKLFYKYQIEKIWEALNQK